jgi:hypothetical protein
MPCRQTEAVEVLTLYRLGGSLPEVEGWAKAALEQQRKGTRMTCFARDMTGA